MFKHWIKLFQSTKNTTKKTKKSWTLFTNKHPERYVPLGTYMNGCILKFF